MADFIFKFIIIGDTSVGKSCLLLQFTERQFRLDHEATIGVEFAARMIHLDDKAVKLQVWDTAGLENFQALTTSYYRGASAALLVYDISKRVTFNSLPFWLNQAREYAGPDITILLVGNKSDLERREVSHQEAYHWAQQQGIHFLEASAKTGQNVEEAFMRTARMIMKNVDKFYEDGTGGHGGMRMSREAKALSEGKCVDLRIDSCCG